MAENINISFAPNKAASDTQRITDLEQYVSTLTERTKFAFASVIEDYSESNADDNMKIINMIYQTACEAVSVGVSCGDGSSVWFNISAGGENQPETNIDPNVSYSCIGGRSNQAHTQCYAISIAGESNAAYASSFSSISGQLNTAKGDMYSTISGMDNTATSTTRCIISGNGNKVTNSDGSVVSGQQNTVTGNFSVIVANGAEVSGSDNIIVGEQHTVNGSMNAVFGNNNTVKGSKNIVSGDCNDAASDNSVVLGTSNIAKNGSSYIVGSVNEVTGMNFVYGMGNTASGAHNIAIGENLKIDNSDNINGYSQTAIGTYMDTEQLESYDGRWRFVIADGNYDNPHNLIYVIEGADGKRKLYFGCDIDLPSASDTALGAVKAGENISISADGTISVDLSSYLQSTDIADWAKADEKPVYTAEEVGAAAKKHTHTKSDITDFPTLGTAAGKNIDYFAAAEHTHTAADVGAATAADITAAVNAVSIGGRNIIRGTAEAVIGYGGHSKGHWRKYGTAGTIQTVDITDTPISCVSKGIRLTSTDENSQIICGQDDIPLNSGVIYTFSCRIRSNSAQGVPCRLQPFYKSTTDHSGNTQDMIISDEWQYISFTAKFSPQSTGTYSGARIYLQPTAAGNYIEVCAMKFEAGNKPTDWTPAPEDAERRITSLEARVAALEAAAVSGGEV